MASDEAEIQTLRSKYLALERQLMALRNCTAAEVRASIRPGLVRYGGATPKTWVAVAAYAVEMAQAETLRVQWAAQGRRMSWSQMADLREDMGHH